jgi:hypothetical protein
MHPTQGLTTTKEIHTNSVAKKIEATLAMTKGNLVTPFYY